MECFGPQDPIPPKARPRAGFFIPLQRRRAMLSDNAKGWHDNLSEPLPYLLQSFGILLISQKPAIIKMTMKLFG